MNQVRKKVALVIEDSELLKKVEQIIHAVDGVSVDSYGSLDSYLSIKNDSMSNLLIMERKAISSKVDQIEEVGKIKTIFLIEDKSESIVGENLFSIRKNRLLSELAPVISETVGDGGSLHLNVSKREQGAKYLKLDIKTLSGINVYPCDVYISLTAKKFVKIINKGTKEGESNLSVYIQKGVEEVWLTRQDFYKYADVFFPREKFISETTISPEQKAAQVLELLHNTVEGLGFSKKAIENVNNLIGQLGISVKNKDLSKIIKKMNNSAGSFLYNHSFLIGIISTNFLKAQHWNSPENQQKLVMSAMFHDLGFENKNNVIFESSDPRNMKKNMSLKDRMDIVSHVDRIVSIFEKNSDIHEDIVKIVQCHHYSKDKILSLSETQFSRLCAVFYLAHEATLRLFKVAFNPDKISKVIESVREDFNYGPFKGILDDFCTNLNETIGSH